MTRRPSLLAIAFLLLACGIPLGASPARAQEYTWSLSVLGGSGASLSEGGSGALGLQVGFGLQFEPQSIFWARLGELDIDTGRDRGALANGSMRYLNLGGEYQFTESYFESGVFLGLGAYQVDGRTVLSDGTLAPASTDTVVGLVLGASGEFKVTPHFFFLVEIAGHILNSDQVGTVGTAHAGIGFHF